MVCIHRQQLKTLRAVEGGPHNVSAVDDNYDNTEASVAGIHNEQTRMS